MRYLFLLCIFVLAGCSSLKRKSVNLLGAGSALHIKTSLNKDGSFSPEVFLGSKASIISSDAPVENTKHSPTVVNISRSYSLMDYFFGNTMGNVCISYTSDKDIDSYNLKILLDVLDDKKVKK